MFQIDLSPTYWWPVKFHLPRQTGGTFDTASLDIEFHRLPAEDVDALFKRARDEQLSDAALCPALVAGWKGVQAKDGAAVPFSPLNLARALALGGLGTAIVRAFVDSQSRAAEKN